MADATDLREELVPLELSDRIATATIALRDCVAALESFARHDASVIWPWDRFVRRELEVAALDASMARRVGSGSRARGRAPA